MNDSIHLPGNITTNRFVIFLLISTNDNKTHGLHIIVDLAIKDIRFYAW